VYETQDKGPKDKHKRGKEKAGSHNQALSSYAAMLTVEFLVKVGLTNFLKNIDMLQIYHRPSWNYPVGTEHTVGKLGGEVHFKRATLRVS